MKNKLIVGSLVVLMGISSAPVFSQAAMFDFFKSTESKVSTDKKYTDLNLTRNVDKNKIIVQEFFSFGCPHCSDFSSKFSDWSSKQPKYVVVEKIPVTFDRPEWETMAKLYYTLKEMNLANKDADVFYGIHKEHLKLWESESIYSWAKSNNINIDKFKEVFNSEKVAAQVKNGDMLSRKYKIDGVPSIVIGDNYRISSSGGFDVLLKNSEDVINKLHNGENLK